MQRVRTSLPYYREMGWEPVIICVDDQYVEGFRDNFLTETIPPGIDIHKVKAWPLSITRKLGLGSLSMRSYYQIKKKGSQLLQSGKFDLVFFSTTMFHVIALGRYWKEKFGVPFVVDMQDPWRNDFYLSKPKEQRPPKFKIAYTIHKKMEAYTIPHVDGIIAVSQGYIDTLKERYPSIADVPAQVIPFGVSEKDFDFVKNKNLPPEIIDLQDGKIKVVYVGAITPFFLPLLKAFFLAFKEGVKHKEKYHFYFIGTNYSVGKQLKSVENLSAELELGDLITEEPARIPYFSALATLIHADILFIPGSTDEDYNASKLYNNVFAGKPIFTMFNRKSTVYKFIKDIDCGLVVGLDKDDDELIIREKVENVITAFQELHLTQSKTDYKRLEQYSARKMTEMQVGFFNSVVR